jgi:hypothetical protein
VFPVEKSKFGKLLTASLSRHGFLGYGDKLFYRELDDSIVILDRIFIYGGAELYLKLIIKECHPEIGKITRSILNDKMLIDTHTCNKLLYKWDGEYKWDFMSVTEEELDQAIDDLHSEYIAPFERGYLIGIKNYNESQNHPYDEIQLYFDIAEKIGHPELASWKSHDYYLSDEYYLTEKCGIDNRYVNSNTAKYIIDNVIKAIPEGLSKKEAHKWCNNRCKEIFISKKFRRWFGYLTFPFMDGKPLKFYNTDIHNGRSVEVYVDEETGDFYHCIAENKSGLDDLKYEIYKVEKE